MNIITIMGRITGYPELKTTQSGVSVTSFTLAVDRAYTPKGQDKQTDFINCVAWRNTAEFISKYFAKGNKIAVHGELQQRGFTDKDGNKRSVYEVVVDRAFFCEGKAEQRQAAPSVPNSGEFEEIVSDEELPF